MDPARRRLEAERQLALSRLASLTDDGLARHQCRRRARPGGPHHRLRAVPDRRPHRAGPPPPGRGRRGGGSRRVRDVRRLRELRPADRGRPARRVASGTEVHRLRRL